MTLILLRPQHGENAIVDDDIITQHKGGIIHDCWASYLSYGRCTHGLGASHLLRELAFIFDANHYKWAKAMKHLLQAACRKVSKSKSKILTTRSYKHLQKRYCAILICGKKSFQTFR